MPVERIAILLPTDPGNDGVEQRFDRGEAPFGPLAQIGPPTLHDMAEVVFVRSSERPASELRYDHDETALLGDVLPLGDVSIRIAVHAVHHHQNGRFLRGNRGGNECVYLECGTTPAIEAEFMRPLGKPFGKRGLLASSLLCSERCRRKT